METVRNDWENEKQSYSQLVTWMNIAYRFKGAPITEDTKDKLKKFLINGKERNLFVYQYQKETRKITIHFTYGYIDIVFGENQIFEVVVDEDTKKNVYAVKEKINKLVPEEKKEETQAQIEENEKNETEEDATFREIAALAELQFN